MVPKQTFVYAIIAVVDAQVGYRITTAIKGASERAICITYGQPADIVREIQKLITVKSASIAPNA